MAIHVSTSAETFDVDIYRDGATFELVHTERGINGESHPTPDHSYRTGCGWPVALTVGTEGWRPGGYVVVLNASDERGTTSQDAFFVLRTPTRRTANLAVVLATNTWQAYNDWGGGSSYALNRELAGGYGHGERPGQRSLGGFSPVIAFDRPWGRGFVRCPPDAPRIAMQVPERWGWTPRQPHAEWAVTNGYSYWSASAGWAQFDSHFIRWVERQGIELELLAQSDLDGEPECLDEFSVVFTVGHDEYWTASERSVLDKYVARGGRYARLAGNILWQVRHEAVAGSHMPRQICYKYAFEQDPEARNPDTGLRTGPFESVAISDPPVTTFGGNGGRGMYSRMGGSSPRGIGGFIVFRNEHWLFDGTDLYYGDVLGRDVPLVGYESDGVSYTFIDGLPEPTGEDGTPPALEILALTPGSLLEEDHKLPGAFLPVGDGDYRFMVDRVIGQPGSRRRLHGSAAITFMPKASGEVICCGSTEWPWALACGDTASEQVVKNILKRSNGSVLPPAGR